eukprot:CAMPEP_0181229570 /NCGR_PEP_ID=MMETSP1096-20121128/33972_1 /TAXON_ID=156174 ORGANISM="Chrysochromulina ericina, Strain CCMP281" /NCGR_SAMPLE_ID=MMETSP1096 /ASSEMBLY_ACC=CAM_ASM_000453 /LENGTH=153 /DNA_ID=CAMNT_0023323211 /DNA_START=141 /DNA_END=601 /DNA_ORIENTATION=-
MCRVWNTMRSRLGATCDAKGGMEGVRPPPPRLRDATTSAHGTKRADPQDPPTGSPSGGAPCPLYKAAWMLIAAWPGDRARGLLELLQRPPRVPSRADEAAVVPREVVDSPVGKLVVEDEGAAKRGGTASPCRTATRSLPALSTPDGEPALAAD